MKTAFRSDYRTRTAKNKKARKIDLKSQQKKRFLKKQREEKDFWDEHKDLQLKSSSDKSNFDEFSYDEQSSNKKSLEVDDKRKDNT